jgi:hypothetical protein
MPVQKGCFRSARKSLNWQRGHSGLLLVGRLQIMDHHGRFALHDVVQRTPGPILFPVPWARTQEISHGQHLCWRFR